MSVSSLGAVLFPHDDRAIYGSSFGPEKGFGAGGAGSPTTSLGYHFKFKLVLVSSQVPFCL